MYATIDAGGRVVVPKDVRERLEDREGALVAVADTDLPVLTAAQVRDAVEATRR
jgi:AbrB family looped-hinge helix DNA binding protein